MIRKLSLPPLMILALVICLLAGELVSGTSLYFASMAALAVLFACLTYNILGGLGSMSGIAFARFALSTLVISQIGKAIVLERADQNLDTPRVVITVYVLYFFSAMVGTLVLSRLRLPLPKPAEPETPTQLRYLYIVALAGGLLGAAGLFIASFQGESGMTSLRHGVSLVLSEFLPFSLVLAVDDRIRSTSGRHSFGWMALWPTLAMELQGFLGASRQGFIEPFAVIFLTAYLRGFRFRKRHFAGAAAAAAGFFLFLSPFYLYARSARGSPTPGELAQTMIQSLELAPSQWASIKHQVGSDALATPGAVNYFDSPSAVTLNRFALIGSDSTLISACARGYHYGFTSLKLDFVQGIPRFLYRNKPDAGSGMFLGQLDGQEPDYVETTIATTITQIADSYGAFSWLGVAVFAFFALPMTFVVFESMFDMRKPWGTVAAVLLLLGFTEGSMGHVFLDVTIKDPIYLLVLSWSASWIVRMIPALGDRAVTTRRLDSGSLAAVTDK